MQIKREIARVVLEAIKILQDKNYVNNFEVPEIIIEKPQNETYGDYSTSIALRLSRICTRNPIEIAEKICECIYPLEAIESVSYIKPGFINFKLSKKWLYKQLRNIVEDENWLNVNIGNGQKVQIEYVSVNPTGPLHVGHGRGAVLGSTLSNILRTTGFSVQTEYYINDAGNQVDIFKRSLAVRILQIKGFNVEMPRDGYMGNYMFDVAKEVLQTVKISAESNDPDHIVSQIGDVGTRIMLDKIRQDLKDLNIEFDNWFSEKSLKSDGTYDKVMEYLKDNNYVVEKDGAVWFVANILGEDKENVLIRGDGIPTYYAYDIAYHYDKFIKRKFDKVIDIWGADHQGHVSRMKAAVSAFGINPDNLVIIICQLVTLKRGNEVVRVSKRSGELVTLRELIDEVGKDACRYVFLSRSADSQMDFDIELAKKQSLDNPVYYIQYAHARISSILRLAREKNIDYSNCDVSLLKDDEEISLIKQLIQFTDVLEYSAVNLEPHHLAYYTLELAKKFHSFYKKCRVISENIDQTLARLNLVAATQIIISRSLSLMGIEAPERM